MLKKKLGGAKETIRIAIARSEVKRKDIKNQIGFREIGNGKL